jgi:hypothetical protein
MARNAVTIAVVVVLLIFLALVTLMLSTTYCPSLFFCSPDPTALFAGILVLLIYFGARLAADLAVEGLSPSHRPTTNSISSQCARSSTSRRGVRII